MFFACGVVPAAPIEVRQTDDNLVAFRLEIRSFCPSRIRKGSTGPGTGAGC